MIEDYVIAIDVSTIYASLGGEKPDHKPSDKREVLKQARDIINNASIVFTFIVFTAEFTNDNEFLAVKNRLFTVKIDQDKNYLLSPKSLDATRIFKEIAIKYGKTVQKEIDYYIENAKEYYKLNASGNGQLSNGIRVIQPPGAKQSNAPENTEPAGSTQAPSLQG